MSVPFLTVLDVETSGFREMHKYRRLVALLSTKTST